MGTILIILLDFMEIIGDFITGITRTSGTVLGAGAFIATVLITEITMTPTTTAPISTAMDMGIATDITTPIITEVMVTGLDTIMHLDLIIDMEGVLVFSQKQAEEV